MSKANFMKLVKEDRLGDLTATGRVRFPGIVAKPPGVGISGGTGTVVKSAVQRIGGIIKTTILIDITGLGSSTTDLDIIGKAGGNAAITEITAAINGTIVGGMMTCFVAPTTGVTDIDVYAAAEGTATLAFDYAIGSATEAAILTRGAAWVAGDIKPFTALPTSAKPFIYLTCGAAGTVGDYATGTFLIELYGV